MLSLRFAGNSIISVAAVFITCQPHLAQKKKSPARKSVTTGVVADAKLPAGAVRRFGRDRMRHRSIFTSIAVTRDGKWAATTGYDRVICVWNLESQKRHMVWPTDQTSESQLLFSGDGNQLFAVDKTMIYSWDVKLGKLVWKCPAVRRHSRLVHVSRVDLLVGIATEKMRSGDVKTYIDIWDTRKGKLVRDLVEDGRHEECLACSPDGKQLAMGSNDGVVTFWDIATWRKRKQFKMSATAIKNLAFSPNGRQLLVQDIRMNQFWNLAEWKKTWSYPAESHRMCCPAFSAKGKKILVRRDYALAQLDAATGKEVARWRSYPYWISYAAQLTDGRHALIATTQDQGTLCVLDLDTMKMKFKGEGHYSAVGRVAYSPDGSLIATCSGTSLDPDVRIWDVKTGRVLRRLRGHKGTVNDVAFSPDGKLLASGAQTDNTLRLWDVRTGKQLRCLKEHPGHIVCLAFSPDGDTLASAHTFMVVRGGKWVSQVNVSLWDVAIGKLRQEIVKGQGWISRLAFSPDRQTIAVAEHRKDATIAIYDVQSGIVRRAVKKQHTVQDVNFSPDGCFLFLPQFEQKSFFYDVLTGETISFGDKFAFAVYEGRFSPDGRILATCARDRRHVQLWDTRNGKLLHKFAAHPFFGARAVDFSPDGKHLVMGGNDCTAVIWDMTPVFRKLNASPPARISEAELRQCWQAMAAKDATKAFRAGNRIIASGTAGVTFLKKVLQPEPRRDTTNIERWIADLDSRRFAVREKAAQQLLNAGRLAFGPLRKTLKKSPPLEVFLRINILLKKIDSQPLPPATLQALRAIRVLMHVATPEARHLLESLARGQPGMRLTVLAANAYERLAVTDAKRLD